MVPGIGDGTRAGWRVRDGWVLAFCVLIVPVIYFPYLFHNLPVAANVDERTSLAVLLRFDHGSLNPQFFMYPTLYYYLTYLCVAPFSVAHYLLVGRAVNLGLAGLTGFVTYAFCQRHLGSQAAGLIAAVCVITSTTISNSGAYLCTDVLLAAATMGSLYFLVEYFAGGGWRAWLPGMVLLGAAVGSKYTAFLLFVAYYLVELAARGREDEARFSRTAVIVCLLGGGVAAGCAAGFFPVQDVLGFVAKHRSNADLRDPGEYLRFFAHLRRLLAEVAGVSVLLAIAVGLSGRVYACVSRTRPYLGLLIVVVVCYLSTPYSLIDPKRFVYDLGALARANIVGQGAEWGAYAGWLFGNENAILVALGVVGLGLIAATARRQLLVAAVYVALYGVVIGSAHVGFPRYLTPVLPLLYCGAGVALVRLWQARGFPQARWSKVVAVGLAVVIAVQLTRRIAYERAASRDSDAFLASYWTVRQNVAGTAFYAGYAPSVELEAAGVKTKQVSWAALSGGGLGSRIGCGDVLILDEKDAALQKVDTAGDGSVAVLLDERGGDGQEVVRRRGCP